MTIQFEKEKLSVISMLQEDNTQNIIEGDIIVPDTKPDVVSIIKTDGVVSINSKEFRRDMIVVRGGVEFNILYQSDDPLRAICNINHTISFDQTIDIRSEDTKVNSQVEYKIEHLDSSIINGRKINIKAILDCYTNISKEYETLAVSNIENDDVQVYTKSINFTKELEGQSTTSFVNWETDIPIGKPAIKEILRTDVYLADKDIKVTSGKAVIRGNLEVNSLYVPDLNESAVEFVTSQIPFSEVIDISGIESDDELNITIKIDSVSSSLKVDEDGDMRVIDYAFSMGYYPVYNKKQTFQVIEDAYSISSILEFEKNKLTIPEIVNVINSQTSIKDIVSIPGGGPLLEKIYWIDGRASISEVNIQNKKASIDGIIDASITYISENVDDPVVSYKHQIPFHNEIDLKTNDESINVVVIPELDKFYYDNVNSKGFELKNILTLNVIAKKDCTYEIISEIDEVPLEDSFKTSQPSMIVYYVQHGDTLWSIAKKYFTTIMQLQRVNNIENPDILQVGRQLLIPKMI